MARSLRAFGALTAAAILWICTASSAQALDLVVDTFGDSFAASFQACTAASSDCTLRGAIIKANSIPGPHVITLPAGTYTLSISGANEDAAATGDLDILQNITINGVSPAATVITWDASLSFASRDRIFHVLPSGALTIRDMSIRLGGRGYSGAGIAGETGGGVYSLGTFTMERVSSRLHAQSTGAALAINGAGATTIRNSAINNNTADSGAGIFLGAASTGAVLVENTTISNNQAMAGPGGGIRLNSDNGSVVVTLNNVTVSANGASTSGGGISRSPTATVILQNTIVANNTAPATPNCGGTILSQGYNLVWGGDTCGMIAGNNDIVNTGDPKLGALADYGGPTATHPLNAGSAALDKGNPATPGSGGTACAAADQRGLSRALDADGDGIARCDIGAAEGGRWMVVDTTTDSNAAGFQICDSLLGNNNCSLRGAITAANAASPAAAVITLPATGAGNPYRLTVGGSGEDMNATGDLDVRSDITIVGGGAQNTIIDGNQLDRVFESHTAAAGFALRLQDVTVQNGHAGVLNGGGVYTWGQLSLLRVRVRSNTAANGGGLLMDAPDPFFAPSVLILDSAISGNTANAASAASGGGIHQIYRSNVTVTNTTVARNQATGASTGGGIGQNTGAGLNITLTNVTVSGNTAANGGGLGVRSNMTARNSIVAGNTAPANPNCGGTGTPTSQGYNLVFGGGTCGFTQTGDKQNQDPKLGPLQLNGGSTETMALGAGSAAIDAGNPAAPGSGGTACSATDQRGTSRPIDGNGISGPQCDIGAYEAAFCATRGSVSLGVMPGAPGRISVSVTAGVGNITELRLHAQPSTNVQVSIGALVNASGELTAPINAPSAQFSIRRASGTGSGTLPFDVVDGCGVWQTMAGGGPNAWPGGSGASSEPPASPAPSPQPPAAEPPRMDPGPPEPPRTGAPTTASCSPRRPNVGVATVKVGPGLLQATLSALTLPDAPANTLRSVTIGALENATVTLNGSPVSAGQTVTLPAGTQQATLLLDRRAPGQRPDLASKVGLVVVDDCGEWKTFVGGGPEAF